MLVIEDDAPSAFPFAVVVFMADDVRGTRRGAGSPSQNVKLRRTEL
jgi:hypothetical protein